MAEKNKIILKKLKFLYGSLEPKFFTRTPSKPKKTYVQKVKKIYWIVFTDVFDTNLESGL
jgi:hypothetical protein